MDIVRIRYRGDKKNRHKAIFGVEYGFSGVITAVIFFLIFNLITLFFGRERQALNLAALLATIPATFLCEYILRAFVCTTFFGEFPTAELTDLREKYFAGDVEIGLFVDYLHSGPKSLNTFALFAILFLANFGLGIFDPMILVVVLISAIPAYRNILKVKKRFFDEDKISPNLIIQLVLLELLLVITPLVAMFILN